MELYLLFEQLYKINILLILLLVFLVPLFLFIRSNRNEEGVRKLPPGPARLPLIGNLHHINDLPHRSLERLSVKYGPLMFLRLGSAPTLVVSSADMVREIFKTHDLAFSGRPALYAAKRLSYECTDIVFASYGEYWREIRKIAVLELLSAKKVQSFQTARKEELAQVIASIAFSDGTINLSDTLLRLANNVVCRVVFGRKYEESDNGKNGIHALLLQAQELLGGFSVADFFPWLGWIHKLDGLDTKLENVFRTLDEFYDGVIQEHLNPKRPKPEVEDLVDVMLRLQRDPSQKFALSNTHIKGVLTDMFIAATDTSAATLVWTMAELIKNPKVMKKAQDEVRHLGGEKEIIEENDLCQLKYLELVVKEAMRVHPPAPLLVPRETTDDCTIQGFQIPAKTRVFINAQSIGKDSRSWENPEKFWPERFLGSPIDFKGQDCEYIPFGLGRRGCPGINFALVFIELVLANLLHCFDWELPEGLKRGDVDMKEAFGITMHKKIPLCLIARSAKTA